MLVFLNTLCLWYITQITFRIILVQFCGFYGPIIAHAETVNNCPHLLYWHQHCISLGIFRETLNFLRCTHYPNCFMSSQQQSKALFCYPKNLNSLSSLNTGVNKLQNPSEQGVNVLFFIICNHNPFCGGHSITISFQLHLYRYPYYSITAWLVMKLFLHFVSVRMIDQV